jgi:putative chitinase
MGVVLSLAQLKQIMPSAGRRAEQFVGPINEAALMNGISVNRLRLAAFLSQIGHESAQLLYVKELGGDKYLSKYDTGSLAKRLGNTPEADGDGQLYAGRGLIQVTGRANYLECSHFLFGDDRLLRTPQLLEQPEWAVKSAAWYWTSRKINAIADTGNIEAVTRKVNGGLNGIEDRKALYARALKVLPG